MRDKEEKKMAVRKMAALSGSVLMGFGSFMACLGTGGMITAGNVLLVISLALSIWGFAKWQP